MVISVYQVLTITAIIFERELFVFIDLYEVDNNFTVQLACLIIYSEHIFLSGFRVNLILLRTSTANHRKFKSNGTVQSVK